MATVDIVVKVLRSLLIASRDGLSERQLRREYKEFEGTEIPYKNLGFSTLSDFLHSSDEFVLRTTNDGMHVQAKLRQNIIHMVEMVQTQNRTKKKGNAKVIPFSSRFHQVFYSNLNFMPLCTVLQRIQRKIRGTNHEGECDFSRLD